MDKSKIAVILLLTVEIEGLNTEIAQKKGTVRRTTLK